jgi:hypothetical protein
MITVTTTPPDPAPSSFSIKSKAQRWAGVLTLILLVVCLCHINKSPFFLSPLLIYLFGKLVRDWTCHVEPLELSLDPETLFSNRFYRNSCLFPSLSPLRNACNYLQHEIIQFLFDFFLLFLIFRIIVVAERQRGGREIMKDNERDNDRY